ncbi:UDP-N-acetylglucosamine 1-carboxyvinyltransferase [Ignatzschineria rhizosphaerae]|uniref:UDP-N-acetylglucosamine 1-carboxyvinyltransferase n=1 Tax=Ignatzschineria rhizosphaerae TaxID=2923279 RepID=A0ABY3X3U9_9GAMM|nr:UDP-N-acetylglucosamine 1-carboxyvinyltransferase [Ignatzschineria rhizosphaerae]UNM97556.1 UDP-N-acetylglucosamine 1-carboxyvinyltransferase [Ignatzschineria rhizosphaerae]
MVSKERLLVEGNGALKGSVRASGAKNAVLPILAATILASEPVTLKNVPKLQDVIVLSKILEDLGAKVTTEGDRVTVDPSGIHKTRANHDLVSQMRASILVLGPILAKFGEAEVSLPGGCNIGSRPVDQHLLGMEALGADIKIENGYVHATVGKGQKLQGNHHAFDVVTVTGAENVLMAAVLASGVTILDNCAKEPEVSDLALMLNQLGAKIEGIGTDRLTITGVDKLSGGEYSVMPDRIEIGTYMVAGAMTFGDIVIEDCVPEHLEAVSYSLRQAGCHVDVTDREIRVYPDLAKLKALRIKTAPYPLFATDMQAQFMAMAAISEGSSTIMETIFENRFMHANELVRMGADIKIDNRIAFIEGVPKLSGASVTATDLRASAALILAGLVADGTTTIGALHHLDRGYDSIEEKLTNLGAKIKRITLA